MTKKRLTEEQQKKLDDVRSADEKWRNAKQYARTAIRKEIEEMVAYHELVRRRAVIAALEAGVPKSRVGNEGLGTSSPNVVYEIIEREERFQ